MIKNLILHAKLKSNKIQHSFTHLDRLHNNFRYHIADIASVVTAILIILNIL